MDLALTLALVLPWAVIVFLGFMLVLLLRQHGQALLNQDDVRNRLQILENTVSLMRQGSFEAGPSEPQGLVIGSPAPEFALPDLEGRERKLQDFLGQPLLVIFWSPQCGFCRQMAPRLAELPQESPRVLLVSHGDMAENRQMAEEYRWQRCDMVVEAGWDVSTTYASSGTPTGYLLDAEGRVASSLAIGADALLQLVEAAPAAGGPNGQGDGRAADQPAPAAGGVRHGLAPGAPAPDFSLPDLAGKQRSLSEFRGKRVLLVFSEPDCVPCQLIAKELARRYRKGRDNLEMLMVSRGDAETNRAKAREHGISFPVLLQQQWEVSKQYDMFASPAAYLIDEQGLISADAAVGPDAVLQLG